MAKVLIRDRNKGTGKSPNWEYRFEGAKVAGKRTSISKCGFKTKKEAQVAGTKAFTEYYSGGSVFKPSAVSFSDLVDKWLDLYASVNLRKNTIVSYRQLFNKHLIPIFGSMPISGISSEQIQSYINNLKKAGYSRSHCVAIFSLLSSVLGYAVEPLKFINANPCTYVRVPHFEENKKRGVISPEKWDAIISKFPEGNRFFVPLMIGYYTGMRVSEVTGLTWDCFDENKKTLIVKQQLVYTSNDGWFLVPPKTGTGVRTILISDDLVSILSREKMRQEANKSLYGEFYKTYDLLPSMNGKGETISRIVPCVGGFSFICSDENGEVTTSGSIRYLSRVIRKMGISDFDFHSIRHTHATILVAGGANYKAIQERMGHARIETTLQTYAHNTEELSADAVAIFDRFNKK